MQLCLDHMNNLFSFVRIMYTSYTRYSPMPSGGLRETEEGTCDASESKATRTQVQRASASSYIKSM
jgi:hypothetical protein